MRLTCAGTVEMVSDKPFYRCHDSCGGSGFLEGHFDNVEAVAFGSDEVPQLRTNQALGPYHSETQR
jgi:hypothetical protein